MVQFQTIAVRTYPTSEVLDMEVLGDARTIREELIERLASALDVPEEARDIWFGEVEVKGDKIEVTLAYDKDLVHLG